MDIYKKISSIVTYKNALVNAKLLFIHISIYIYIYILTVIYENIVLLVSLIITLLNPQ